MSKSTISTFQLFDLFPDAESARLYLEDRLWPDGPKCLTCKSGERITVRKGGFKRCNRCQLDFTWRTGTVFERSHIPTDKVCAALYLICREPEISPKVLAKTIGVTHKTGWLLLRKIRLAAGDFFSRNLDLDNPRFRVLSNPAYRVGEDGSVWTRWRRRKKIPQLGFSWRLLKTFLNLRRGGYRNVLLYNGQGQQKHERVCRLVCTSFHGPCPAGMECNHRNGNPADDAAENLFWGSHKGQYGNG